MDTRKLQQVGGGTYTVSLPKQWAVEHGLEAGETLNLYTHADGSIVVRSAPREASALDAARIELHRRGPDVVTRALRTAQALGFDTVTLARGESFTDEERRAVRRTVRSLVGTELVDDGATELVVRTLLDAGDVSIRQTVAHLRFTSLSIHRQGTEALAEGDPEAYVSVSEREREATRLVDLVTRHFSRSLVSFEEVDRLTASRSELLEYFLAAQGHRRVAEQAVALARLGKHRETQLPNDVGAELERLASESRTVVDDATSALLNASALDAVDEVFAHSAETRADVDAARCALLEGSPSMFDDVGATEVRQLVSAFEALAQTLDAGDDVATAAARSVVRSQCL